MMNKKPEHTLDEDLKILGLAKGDSAPASEEGKKPLAEEEMSDSDEDDKDMDEKAKKDKKDDKDSDKKLPPWLQKKDSEKSAEEAKAEYTEQLEAAWDVIRDFYKLSEDDNKSLVPEALRTVIEAQSFLIEAMYNSDEPSKEPNDVPGGNETDLFPAGENPRNAGENPALQGPLANKMKNAEAGKGYNLSKTGAAKGEKGSPASPYHRSQQVKTESLSDLVAELKAIKAAVTENAPSSEQIEAAQDVVEGYEAVRDTAAEVATRIKADLAEDKNATKDDDRVKAGDFFESIISDCNQILTSLAEGKLELADAAEDLKLISTDLKNGLDRLNSAE